MNSSPTSLRIAATADIHYTASSRGACQDLFAAASQTAEVLLLCGDLTENGGVEEAQVLANDLRSHARVPVLCVLGNHDFESGHASEVTSILQGCGAILLDGESTEVGGVGFAGVCGFGGGFGRAMLNAWGEPLMKAFAHEAVDHAMRLERALSRLEMPQRVVLMHYAPIRETVAGEPLEIYPFLGSSRLEGPLNRCEVTAAFHGHAHNGAPEGRTSGNTPVYNVAISVLKRMDSHHPGFRVVKIPITPRTPDDPGAMPTISETAGAMSRDPRLVKETRPPGAAEGKLPVAHKS